MVKRFLITTALEETWRNDKPVLFLGEWCRLYNRISAWHELDAEVAPYHWDDREKLHRDYLYLQALYEELLQELSAQLNNLHGVNHSLRYWRILVGPWLGYFVQMLFDRWTMIERVVADYHIDGVRVLEYPPELIIPNDMDHFQHLFSEDAWNEVIYSQLIQGWTTISVEKVQTVEKPNTSNVTQPILSPFRRLKRKIARAASVVSQMLVRENEAFFLSSYLPIVQDFRLQWSMKQIPKLWRSVPTPKVKVDWARRQWQTGTLDGVGFPTIVRTMVPRHLPTVYLEGYEKLQTRCANLPWPSKPNLIFTSNAYHSDDMFKAWAAEKIEGGSPLVIGQHGGNYGIALWGFTEDHQIAISDCFISWGWDNEKSPKLKPVCNLKMIGHTFEWNPNGHALMVEMSMPRYSYHMYSIPVASQWLSYFKDQCRFVCALPNQLQAQLLVRLYPNAYGWCDKQRWHDQFPAIQLDSGAIPITKLIENSRLYISTYNATTFLESMAMNMPTIIFWNPEHWELRESAIPYFEQLKTVGIFHETPESAAQQMTLVWDDVADWWNSIQVQSARKAFCHRYSRMLEQPLDDLEHVLRPLARQPLLVKK